MGKSELLGNWRHLKRILLDARVKDILVAGSTLVRAMVGMH